MDAAPQTQQYDTTAKLDDETSTATLGSFENPGEGFLSIDEEQAAFEEMQRAVQARIARNSTVGMYLVRHDTGRVVLTDEEYQFCEANAIPCSYVRRGIAEQMVGKAIHNDRELAKRRQRNRNARKQRKINRKAR